MEPFVEVHGAGSPAVLTHGYADTHETWDAQVEGLERAWTVWTWDLRGHGRSPHPDEETPYSRSTALADLGSVVARARGEFREPVALIGHSLGGYLSLHHCIKSPDDVRALVLVATGPGFRNARGREAWERTLAAAKAPDGVSRFASRLAGQPDSFVIDNLDRIDVPTLIVVGGDDRRFRGAADYLSEKLRYSTLMVVDSAGHGVHRTHAAEVNESLRGFLETV